MVFRGVTHFELKLKGEENLLVRPQPQNQSIFILG